MVQNASSAGNRLLNEKSPYLLQHARNPVDWYPWGGEAFERARKENKPIFLSIGYSTCHWCHVMERESFEDPLVAGLMNNAFICIKVDREERPDIDKLYMTVCQMMTGSGGWPLTIIMTPDKKPFFAGTYIPKESRFGRAGMTSLIPAVEEAWTKRSGEVLSSADQIISIVQRQTADEPECDLTESALSGAYEQLSGRFDKRFGGFGTAPKFPAPHNLLFLLRYWRRSGEPLALDMAHQTLTAMRQGGMYDHIGFGFHRYSTDERWLVPHFEKMLYDQALLTMAYTEAFQVTGNKEFEQTAREIIAYVLRDMTSEQGGFYSAEDADSEGEEGKFYLWSREEVESLLPADDARLFLKVFHAEKGGNFRDEATGRKATANILHLTKPLSVSAAELGMPEEKLRTMVEAARRRLFSAREMRAHPFKDDKILTDWNGLMIAALARASQALDDSAYARSAQQAADFILGSMLLPNGRLLHRYRAAEAAVSATLDDYAFFIWGLLDLYEATFEARYLQAAITLNRDVLDHFWDETGEGGFFFSADDGEALLLRQKEIHDGALPSGNSVALHNLLRLARMTANADFEKKAARIGKAFSSMVTKHPSAAAHFLTAFDFALGPSCEVVIAGSLRQAETRHFLKKLREPFLPDKVVLLRTEDDEGRSLSGIAPFTEHMAPINGKPAAYVCSNGACASPTTDAEEMLRLLKAKTPLYDQRR
jgi:hypothetical protein